MVGRGEEAWRVCTAGVAVNRDSVALTISNLFNARHSMQVRKTQGTPLAL